MYYIHFSLDTLTVWVSNDIPTDSMNGLFHNSHKYDDSYGTPIPKSFNSAKQAQNEAEALKQILPTIKRKLAV